MYVEQARPYFIRKVNREETEHWMVFYDEDPIPPIELSVLIGDFLYNLRSALDSPYLRTGENSSVDERL